MFRTRDFILIFTTVLFLVMAIGVTLWDQYRSSSAQDSLVVTRPVDGEYDAEVVSPETLSRAERLSAMREKISADSSLSLSNALPDLSGDVDVDEVDIPETGAVTEQNEEMRCSEYGAYYGSWSPTGLQTEIVEGSRVFFRETTRVITEGTTTKSVTERVTALQLPIQFPNPSSPHCIPSDVIGVALDGSLIRNNERALYSVFGYETLIGYALDGFPIYGTGATPLDRCGGANVGGQYRYFVPNEREAIINCFVARPVSL